MPGTILEFNVTRCHIESGQPQNALSCPLALALRDNGSIVGSIGDVWASVDCKVWLVGDEARKFIHDFDNGKSVEPSTFQFFESSMKFGDSYRMEDTSKSNNVKGLK